MFPIDTNAGYFLHLIKCSLHNKKPLEKPENVSFEEVFKYANIQKFINATFVGISQLDNKPNVKLFKQWEKEYAFNLSMCASQMIELDLLVDTFTSKGFDVMPLKGSIIRNYYPTPDIRSMTDIDFLVRTQDREVVRQIMAGIGYNLIIPDDGQVDTFQKGESIYIDLHYSLMAKNHYGQEHFKDTWDIAVETDRQRVYAFNYEDLYVYNIGHYAKHMYSAGTGMRCVVDAYVLWNNATAEQKILIREKLKEKELYMFNEQLLKVAGIWFNDKEDDGTLDDVQAYFIQTYVYGNESNMDTIRFMNKKGERISKLDYYKKRIFPGVEYLYNRYNVKHRCAILVPFLWIRRMFSVLSRTKEINEEISANDSVSSEDIEKSKQLYSKLGLLENDNN